MRNRTRENPNWVPLNVQIPFGVRDEALETAEAEGQSLSAVVTDAIQSHVDGAGGTVTIQDERPDPKTGQLQEHTVTVRQISLRAAIRIVTDQGYTVEVQSSPHPTGGLILSMDIEEYLDAPVFESVVEALTRFTKGGFDVTVAPDVDEGDDAAASGTSPGNIPTDK